jgi:putative membrane protein
MKLSDTSLAVTMFSIAAVIAAAGPAFAQSSVSAADRAFLMNASEANMGEVAAGGLAAQRGVSADTRALGKRYVDNHRSNQRKLVTLAQTLNVSLPMHPSQADMMEMAKLKGLSGGAFDAAFLAMEEQGHMKNIMAFKHEAATSSNPTIVAYAKASLPVLEEHLQIATDDAAKMKRTSSMGGTMGGGSHKGTSGSTNSMQTSGGANAGGEMSSGGGMSSGAGANAPSGSAPQGRANAQGSAIQPPSAGASAPAQSPMSSGQPGTPGSTGAGATGTSPTSGTTPPPR